jgi:hypothetical protein
MMLFEIYDSILCLLSKLFLSTIVLLQRMILNFIVWKLYDMFKVTS